MDWTKTGERWLSFWSRSQHPPGADVGRVAAIRRTLSERGADLVGADLWGADLVGVNLRGASLDRADLRGADLRGANLRGASLVKANLRRADLRGATLAGANLRGANLFWANLERTNLARANLDRANLARATLVGANLDRATLQDAKLDQVRVNWLSSDLVAELLVHAAGGDREKLKLAGLILVSRDHPWVEALGFDDPLRRWALGVLARYATPDNPRPGRL